jgi:hypothetical protein
MLHCQTPKENILHFYVALNGNDNRSGKLAEPNTSKTDGPFRKAVNSDRTLEKARNEIRKIKNKRTASPRHQGGN